MLRKISLFLFLIIFVSKLYAAQKMRIAIMDLQANNLPKSTAQAVSDLIRTEMFNTGLFRVVERAEMESILKEQGFQLEGCTDTECAVQMGRLLSAHKILVGTVSKLGQSFIVNARIVDVEKGEMEFADKAKAESEGTLDEAVETFARKIAGRIEAKKEGKEITTEFEAPSTPGTGLRLKTPALILMGAGLLSGGAAFLFHSQADGAYDDYKALGVTTPAPTSTEQWNAEWTKVEDKQDTRDLFTYIAIGAGGAGVILYAIDYFILSKSDTTAMLDENKSLYFACYKDMRMGYFYRW